MKHDITEATEKLYNTLKKYIAAHTNIPQEIRAQFKKLTIHRKNWQKELRGGVTDNWIEIEFGVYIDYGQNIEISENILKILRDRVRENIENVYSYDTKQEFIENPFLIFSNRTIQKVLPKPNEYIEQDDGITVRYYYQDQFEFEGDTMEDRIKTWHKLWDASFYGTNVIGWIYNKKSWTQKKTQEWINVDEITYPKYKKVDTDNQTHLYISRIRTSDGKCYSLGHSIKSGLLIEPGCKHIE